MTLKLIVNKEYKKSEFERSVAAHGFTLHTVFTQELKNGYEIEDEESKLKKTREVSWSDFLS